MRLTALLLALIAVARAAGQAPADRADPTPAADKPAANGGLDNLLPAPDERTRLQAYWDNGFRLEAEDKSFRLHIGGNAQVDSTWLIGPHSVFAIPGGGMNGVENSSATLLRRV